MTNCDVHQAALFYFFWPLYLDKKRKHVARSQWMGPLHTTTSRFFFISGKGSPLFQSLLSSLSRDLNTNCCFKYYHDNLYTYEPTVCQCLITKNTTICRLLPTLRTTEGKMFIFFFCCFRDHRPGQADCVHFFFTSKCYSLNTE